MVAPTALEEAGALVAQVVPALLLALLAVVGGIVVRRLELHGPPVLRVTAEVILEAHDLIGGTVGEPYGTVVVLEQRRIDALAQGFLGRERMHVRSFRLARGALENR